MVLDLSTKTQSTEVPGSSFSKTAKRNQQYFPFFLVKLIDYDIFPRGCPSPRRFSFPHQPQNLDWDPIIIQLNISV